MKSKKECGTLNLLINKDLCGSCQTHWGKALSKTSTKVYISPTLRLSLEQGAVRAVGFRLACSGEPDVVEIPLGQSWAVWAFSCLPKLIRCQTPLNSLIYGDNFGNYVRVTDSPTDDPAAAASSL